jgi:hypothetical protein
VAVTETGVNINSRVSEYLCRSVADAENACVSAAFSGRAASALPTQVQQFAGHFAASNTANERTDSTTQKVR